MAKRDDNEKSSDTIARENHAVLKKLSEETKKFKNLCELHSLKVVNGTLRTDVERLRKGVEDSQRKLVELLMKLEDFEGAYQTVQETLLAMENLIRETGIQVGITAAK